jgi:hypothetical protein
MKIYRITGALFDSPQANLRCPGVASNDFNLQARRPSSQRCATGPASTIFTGRKAAIVLPCRDDWRLVACASAFQALQTSGQEVVQEQP